MGFESYGRLLRYAFSVTLGLGAFCLTYYALGFILDPLEHDLIRWLQAR